MVALTLLLIVYTLLIVISYGSRIKYQLRAEYFTPFDISLLKEGLNISQYFSDLVTWKFVLVLLGFIIFAVALFILHKKINVTTTRRTRAIIFTISLLSITLMISSPSLLTLTDKSELTITQSYRNYGFIRGFLIVLDNSKNEIPPNYTESQISKLLTKSEGKSDDIDNDFKPNVIVILAEALWDPLLMENLDFTEDPIPFLRTLGQNHTSGELLVHNFGGGTINTEMEVLTGLTTRFMAEETYNNYIRRPVDSLAHVYRNQGYNTSAIHTFRNWFYGRRDTYKELGFEKFISMEFFNEPDYIGPFIDDRELMKKTLDEMNSSKGPDFINVVTVSSHGPYNDNRYDPVPQIVTGELSDYNSYLLNTYVQSIKDLDNSIKFFIDGVEKLNEPTIVVIYGDHLPLLGDNYGTYTEAGYITDVDSYEDYLKLYTTPLYVWDNFSTNNNKEHLRVTPNFLGAYILDKTKTEKSPIFQLTDDLYKEGIQTIPNKTFFKEENIIEEKLTDYKLLQYDIIKGKQFSYNNYPVKPSESYILGAEKMKVTSLEHKQNKNGDYTILVHGENLISNSEVYIGENVHETTYINSNILSFNLSTEEGNSLQKLKLIVKLIDDQNTVIAKSNLFDFTLEK